ncbi:MAG TPA: pseudouridine synthase [Aliidongia sp.]|nr:pseudouridine synthase [Aliidongia sp.]
MADRIAKVLARAGLCSRRDAERWIAEGRVKLDGTVLTSPAVTVDENSIILVDGKPIAEPEPTRLWRYHKPAGLVTSHKDEKGRETMFDKLPPELGRVISVGRLDLNSEGLILLTNDGGLARRLELPSTGWIRRYKVRIHGTVTPEQLLALERGVTIDQVRYGPIKAEFERQQGANAWCMMALTEGKNREVRRVFEYLGCTVNRLIRLSYGPFQLGALPRGQVEEVPRRVVRDQLGLGPAGDKGRADKSADDKPAVADKAPASKGKSGGAKGGHADRRG